MCNKISSVEWSGVLFYKSSGRIHYDDFKIELVDIFPMHKGTGTSTGFNFHDPKFIKWQAENIEFVKKHRFGLVHSHNNIDAFFSGTDNEELIDNADAFPYYLSVVVNNKGKYVAKIAQRMVHIDYGQKYVTKDDDGNEIEINVDGGKEESTLFISCKVTKEGKTYDVDDWFAKRVTDICKTKPVSKNNVPMVNTHNGKNSSWLSNYQQSFGYDFTDDDLFADVLVDKQDLKTFMFGAFTTASFKEVLDHFTYIDSQHSPEIFSFYMDKMRISEKEIIEQVISMLQPYKNYSEIKKMIDDYEQYKLTACDEV